MMLRILLVRKARKINDILTIYGKSLNKTVKTRYKQVAGLSFRKLNQK
jgi:hypothetical protein